MPNDLLQDLLLTVCFVFQLYNCFLLVFIFSFNDILHGWLLLDCYLMFML